MSEKLTTLPIPIRVFDDVKREFVISTIDPADVVDIADTPTLLPPKATAPTGLLCVRVGLGPGKWVYVDALQVQPLRDAVSPSPHAPTGKPKDIPFQA
jgi:hypothetical protein